MKLQQRNNPSQKPVVLEQFQFEYPSDIYSSIEVNPHPATYPTEENSLDDPSFRQSINGRYKPRPAPPSSELSFDSSIISDIDIPALNDNIVPNNIKMKQGLVVSRENVEVRLINSQSAEEFIRVLNRGEQRVSLDVQLRDPVEGLTISCPKFLECMGSDDIKIEIGEIEEIGDVFNTIIIQAKSRNYTERVEVPLTIRYVMPKIRVDYQGSNELLTVQNNRFVHIRLKENVFKEYSLQMTASHQLSLTLETPYAECILFPDSLLLMAGQQRKVSIRTKNKTFCLVARVTNTNLAYVFKVSVY